MIRILNEGKFLPHQRRGGNTTFTGLAGKSDLPKHFQHDGVRPGVEPGGLASGWDQYGFSPTQMQALVVSSAICRAFDRDDDPAPIVIGK